MFQIVLILLSTIRVIFTYENFPHCPCQPTNTCPHPYGTHPLDIKFFGTLWPCSTYGHVRCCSTEGLESVFGTHDGGNDQDMKNDTMIAAEYECGCIPRGICNREYVHYDLTCTGVFQKCCMPKQAYFTPDINIR